MQQAKMRQAEPLPNALQFDLFGGPTLVLLRSVPRKASIQDVCKIIDSKVPAKPVTAEAAQLEVADDTLPITSSEAISAYWRHALAETPRIVPPIVVPMSFMDADEDVEHHDDEEPENEGGGIIGMHKKLLKMSLKELKAGQDTHDICMWIMDGKDQARLFSFEACCALSEIDPDSLRDNLMAAGHIPQRFLH